MEEVKTCRVCGETKTVDNFHKCKTGKFGVRAICKHCMVEKTREYNTRIRPSSKRRIKKEFISDVLDRYFAKMHSAAKYRSKEFSISIEDIFDLWRNQEGRCAYTKLPLLATANQFNTVSLDRIDSSKGYIVGNIQLVCAAINKMKQDYPEDVFILLSLLVTQNNKLSETPDSLLARYFPVGTSGQ